MVLATNVIIYTLNQLFLIIDMDCAVCEVGTKFYI
jgi:hypothetical protein